MPNEIVSEMILIIAVVIIGLVISGFTISYLIPQVAFTNAQNQASNIAQSSSLSVGPLLISGSTGSAVVIYNNPSITGYVYVIAFAEPSYLQPSVGVVTPTSNPSFAVYLQNGKLANQITINSPIYDVSGKILYSSPITAYQVPFNTPATIVINNIQNNDILVIWIIYNSGGYWFRVSFTFTGVPS
ncbi:hypothetical protein [Sulfurisphaera tokodaii]|uniref:Uncharacterized protein n=2 Tax=Sulfurisphaera tokodaii TaxID=111955 RepID=Q972R1_SULTO|nr:hypothetical protein [Sulfurisphaera tokodaii]BAB66103.1 hypothetical protein STK_10730 [Sulfurisphaera tokodaii str. 7]HII75418.1 hypothetical protein [Sulfurisphaera tokodaii]